MKRKRLGDVLSERGHISSSDLAKALSEQQGRTMHLGKQEQEFPKTPGPQLTRRLASRERPQPPVNVGL